MSRCNRCNGAKKIKGLGCMEIDCPQCKGTGVHHEKIITEDKIPFTKDITAIDDNIVNKHGRKRG